MHIEEPYKEICSVVNDKGARTSKIEHCYCKEDLCNNALKLGSESVLTSLMTVIIISISWFLSECDLNGKNQITIDKIFGQLSNLIR